MLKANQYAAAKAKGIKDGTWVQVKQSEICKDAGQIGIFTLKPFPPREPITWYTSYYLKNSHTVARNAYAMEAPAGINRTAIGVRQLARLRNRGVAQLANDALCPRLSSKTNNCDFLERESLVTYCISRNPSTAIRSEQAAIR